MPDVPPSDNQTYGRVLGEYLETVSLITEMEQRLDDEQLEHSPTYTQLIDQKGLLRARLGEVVGGGERSDLQRRLDEAVDD